MWRKEYKVNSCVLVWLRSSLGKNGGDEMKFQLSMFGESYVRGHFLIHDTCKQTNILMLINEKLLWPSKRQIVKRFRKN